jgi:hypothetical protein
MPLEVGVASARLEASDESDGLFVSEKKISRRQGPFNLSSESSDTDEDRSQVGLAALLVQRKSWHGSAASVIAESSKPQNPLKQRERELSRRQSERQELKAGLDARITKHAKGAKLHESASRNLVRDAEAMMAQAQALMATAINHSEQTRVHREAIEERQTEGELVSVKGLGGLARDGTVSDEVEDKEPSDAELGSSIENRRERSCRLR